MGSWTLLWSLIEIFKINCLLSLFGLSLWIYLKIMSLLADNKNNLYYQSINTV